MSSFKNIGVHVVLGAFLGLGATAAVKAVLPEESLAGTRADAPQRRMGDSYGAYPFGPEGYVAQSDVIVVGRVSRVLDARDVPSKGNKRPLYFHRVELEVDEELYRNGERIPGGQGNRLMLTVPATGMELAAGRAFEVKPGVSQLFFLRRSVDLPGTFVPLRGENGLVDLSRVSVKHEVLRATTPSGILDEVRQYATEVRLSVPATTREPLQAVPKGVTPGRFYARDGVPAALGNALASKADGVLVFDALPRGAVSSRLHILTIQDKCFVRSQWDDGPASGPVALHVKGEALSSTCESLLDKSF
ncbi:hypothetical protein NR798_43425 [Archangium gephyra]|uniref:hypothetical protein n=1 Tax=Archangium gephyra TaxID=48 RepID=UPI0035D4A340